MSESTMTATETPTGTLKPTAPLPAEQALTYAQATDVERAEIDSILAELNLDDTNSVLLFGTAAQTEVT